MTPPERPEETQPDYFNAVAIAESSFAPERILEELMRHEAALGRVRGARWSARTIDLDLLFVGGAVVHTSSLRLPHPELQFRDFVLVPLVEVAPVWRHPLLGKATVELLEALQKDRKELYVREVLEPLEGEKL